MIKELLLLTELLNLIYEHGYISEGMAESIFIQLPKKPNTMKYEEHQPNESSH